MMFGFCAFAVAASGAAATLAAIAADGLPDNTMTPLSKYAYSS